MPSAGCVESASCQAGSNLSPAGSYPSTPARLFGYLPADQALHLYLDLGNARSSEAIRGLFSTGAVEAPEYSEFVEGTGFNYLTDLDAAALSMSEDRIYLLAQGRFDEGRIRQRLSQ